MKIHSVRVVAQSTVAAFVYDDRRRDAVEVGDQKRSMKPVRVKSSARASVYTPPKIAHKLVRKSYQRRRGWRCTSTAADATSYDNLISGSAGSLRVRNVAPEYSNCVCSCLKPPNAAWYARWTTGTTAKWCSCVVSSSPSFDTREEKCVTIDRENILRICCASESNETCVKVCVKLSFARSIPRCAALSSVTIRTLPGTRSV
mmetsp:Transcript_3071/g.8484  ORF Transcript_3071/g.8484 Transcript_3071/m.8484 type:complete len:202 (-) Transcript_3071:1050-1655(-)